MKIVTQGVPHHLCVMDSVSYESKAVCGIILTGDHIWKGIRALEGDECPQCAKLAFNAKVRASSAP